MFAGIVESTARIEEIQVTADGARITICFPFSAKETELGASIALNGVCLTVVAIKEISDSECRLVFEAINETLRKTNLGTLTADSRINFERSITAATRIDGHFVSGHVDGVGALLRTQAEGISTIFHISLVPELAPFLAPKGSITLNGVALTVGEVQADFFAVYIIPHTAQVTNLGELKIGDKINIEIDMVARYVVNFLQKTGVAANMQSILKA